MKSNLTKEEIIKRSDKVIQRNLSEIDEVLSELHSIKEKGSISNSPDYNDITDIMHTCNILSLVGNVSDIEVEVIDFDENQKEQYAKKRLKEEAEVERVSKYRIPAAIAACFAATAVISVATVLAKSQSNGPADLFSSNTEKGSAVEHMTKDVNSTVITTNVNIKSKVSTATNQTFSHNNQTKANMKSKITTTVDKTSSNDNLTKTSIKSTDTVTNTQTITNTNTTKIESPENEPSLLLCDRLKLKNVNLTNDSLDTKFVKNTKDLKCDCYKIEKISIISGKEQLAEIEVTSDNYLISIEKIIEDCKNVYGSDIDIRMCVSGIRNNKVVKKNVGWISLSDIKTPRKSKENKKTSKGQYIKVNGK